jgi:hypothetical protein
MKKWILALLITSQANAYNLSLDVVQQSKDRPYHVSDDCGADVASQVDQAAAIWSYYAGAKLKRVAKLPKRAQRFISVSCQDDVYFREVLLKTNTDANTYWRYANWQMTSADIVYNTDRASSLCLWLHEQGHALGLNHSNVASAMQNPAQCEYLSADDLLGAAALFGTAPNCTPYVSDDFTVYFPNINGEQIELRPIESGRVAGGFYESGRIAAPSGNWKCDLHSTATEIAGKFYHRGMLFSVKLIRTTSGWAASSVSPA